METDAGLQETILDRATDSFRKRGIKATTIKIIAAESGCTNAALYYHYPEGKTQILHESILRLLRTRLRSFESIEPDDLTSFLSGIGSGAFEDFGAMTDNVSWLILEYQELPTAIQHELHEHLKKAQGHIASAVSQFVSDSGEAAQLGWIVFCACFGYLQLFQRMGLASAVDFTPEQFVDSVARVLSRNQHPSRRYGR